MDSKNAPNPPEPGGAPFGAGAIETSDGPARRKEGSRSRRGASRRGSRRGKSPEGAEGAPGQPAATAVDGKEKSAEGGDGQAQSRPEGRDRQGERGQRGSKRRRWQDRRTRRKRKGGRGGQQEGPRPDGQRSGDDGTPREGVPVEGMLVIEKANHGAIRQRDNEYLAAKSDVHVSPRLVQKFNLRDGSIVAGTYRRGQGRYKWDLDTVTTVDGEDPKEMRRTPIFKQLTSIDPDFHYEVGDGSGEVSLKIVDLIAPVGRGQRGLIVAPPRSGKTILLQQFAKAIEKIYPEVRLMVLLVDERPEEATEWRRSIENGEVFVSTNDEAARRHVDLCEVVWRRCRRLVELGEDVVLLLDSITRMGRCYNNVHGNSGKTMSGGIDTRALERPKQFFGSARNTETAGSLTILATTLIETGSRMDQVIFEEFKGTGNSELVLSRKLAERRVFPAIDIQKSGTRKEEKLFSSRRLKLVQTLRRVLLRMHFAEAMELLITKLDDVEKIDDFLLRFEVDPEE